MKSTYDKFPKVKIKNMENEVCEGYENIFKEIKSCEQSTIIVDCYPGVYDSVFQEFSKKKFDLIINSEDIFYDEKTLNQMMKNHLTDDRVRGVMYYGKLNDFVDENKLIEKQNLVNNTKGSILIYGVGATLISKKGLIIYADLARWEIQMRYRNGLPNFKCTNYNEDILKKYKRGFFIEWRIADKHKRELFLKIDYFLDTNAENPKMISKIAFKKSMEQVVNQPFRVVPYFDPGVWGGQWMKEKFNLDKSEKNFAWSFDGVPEENSLLLQFNDIIFEMPSINVVLYNPLKLLGPHVYSRFGAEFPIRFDFLDTMSGQNLSLQVHPTADFIKHEYGMPYTQEESYYILDAKEDAYVYLGFKNNINIKNFEEDLKKASNREIIFNDELYVNKIKTKKHDHFLIPPGTIHCSGEGTMVLEISSSAYIFTFKLWDWDRVGMDGLPRPIHLEEGKKVLNYEINEDFTLNNLVNQFEKIENNECLEENTGLYETEYIKSKRYTFNGITHHNTNNNVNMLNLVSGSEIIIKSPKNKFDDFYIHFAETFIIPANLGEYIIESKEEVKVLKAFVK